MYFHQVAILQRLDEICLHIGVGLVLSFPFHGNAELAHLFGDLFQHQLHAVLRGGSLVFHSCQGQVHSCRVVVHVIQAGKVQQFAHVGVVDAAHGLQLLPLLVQLGVPGGVLRVGEHHAYKVEDLRPRGTGVLHVGQPQPCCDGLCSHGLAGAGRAPEKEISHLGGFPCGELGVLADVHRLLGNDVPLREDGNLGPFSRGQLAAGVQHVLSHKVLMVDDFGGLVYCRIPALGEDGELSCQHLCGLVQPGVQLGPGNPHQVAGFVHVHL